MPKRIMTALIAVVAVLVVPSIASATQPVKQWVCHGTGSESNPYVLIHVPTNVGAHAGHLASGRDVLAADQEHPSCPGGPDQPPVDHGFDGVLYEFMAKIADCPSNEAGVNGFVVTQVTYEDGEEVVREVVFTQDPICIPLVSGPAGPQGPAGDDGSNGANGRSGSDGQDLTACSSKRVAKLRIKKSRGAHVRKLRVWFEGTRLKLHRVSKREWFVKVDMRGVPAGVYGVRVKAMVNGKLFRHVHLYRSCGNGFTQGSLNPKRYVHLGADYQNGIS